MRIIFGFPGWGWKMYGIASFRVGSMWFIGFSKQLPKLGNMEKIVCKCCGKEARWCGEGDNGCGFERCDHIHCDHCGMHYSLESKAAHGAETVEEARALMLEMYNA